MQYEESILEHFHYITLIIIFQYTWHISRMVVSRFLHPNTSHLISFYMTS